MAAAEQKKSYQVIKQFKGVNTKANRTAIDETEFSWLENAMPIGYANLKIVPTSLALSATFTHTVVCFFSCNVGLTDYVIAIESDGSAEYYSLEGNTLGTVAPAGTFTADGNTRFSQWKNQYCLIGDSAKGYFQWDGSSLIHVGSVSAIGITSGGSGYNTAPIVTLSAPNDTNGVQALATATITANAVSSITLTQAGSGYTSPPTITLTGGGGTNASAISSIATFAQGTVSAVVTSGGAGYTNAANVSVTFSGGGGTNAAATAIVAGNAVTQLIMTNAGSGYTNAANLTVTISGGGATTNATAKAFVTTDPITGIASFSGRVWIAQGRTVYYSAAGSSTDFITVSAGNIVLTDETLHGNIIQLLSANNFLYIFGDDSINVFSNVLVQTNGSTVFTNTNVSASVGSKRPYALFPYFRSVLFMNDYGVYALVGSTTSKISDPLDGIFPYIDFTKPVYAGQVLINNILCAAFNFYYTGTGGYGGGRYIQAVFFEKKWFFTSQNNALEFVTSAPVAGLINLYGSDGTNLYRLYGGGANSVSSYVQTALMPMGDPIRTKQALKFGIEATTANATVLNVTVDSEVGSSPAYNLGNYVNWTNVYGNPIPWINNSSATVLWLTSTGYALYKSDAMQWGKYIGLTQTSNSAGFVINTYEFEHELRVRF